MADIIDTANDAADAATERAIAEARAQAANIPAGTAGECDRCGEPSARLVDGACARCRDKWRLP